jgi:hypothetical protein
MPGMIRISLLLIAGALLGCARGDDGTGLRTDRFVDVVVELRQAALDLRDDPAAYDVRKGQILRDAGVTEDQLRAYVEVHGTDLDHMAEVWRSINQRLSERETVIQ